MPTALYSAVLALARAAVPTQTLLQEYGSECQLPASAAGVIIPFTPQPLQTLTTPLLILVTVKAPHSNLLCCTVMSQPVH